MGLLTNFFGGSPSVENPSTSLNAPAQWLVDALGGGSSASGFAVTSQTAMRVSTVFRCQSLIVNTIASLPWGVHQHTDGGSVPFPQHDLHRKLRAEPCQSQTSYTFRQQVMSPALMSGNGYAIIARKRGRPEELLAYPAGSADQVQVTKTKNNGGRLRYRFPFPDGVEELDQADVLHVPGLGFDGIKGVSVIRALGSEPIGLAMALESYAARVAKSSTMVRGIVEVPGSLMGKPNTLKNLSESIHPLFAGESFAAPLDAGMVWKPLSNLNPIDAQILEQRRFQVEDVCRLFGVPPWMVGESSKNTSWGTGIEQQNVAFVTYVLRSWLVALEQEVNRKLFTWPFFCEVNVDGLLRGDSKTRAEVYQSAIRNAWMTPNEARRHENLPPDPAGGRLLADQTLIPLEQLGQPPANGV